MKGNFRACLDHVLKSEGGWSDHPRDPGGATMKGITLKTFRQYRPGASKGDLRNISDADVKRIYREGYWEPVAGDALPPGLDLVAFDAAVNSGVSRGARWVQQALGVKQDGRIGRLTLAAAERHDPVMVIQTAIDIREEFLRGLPTFDTFGRGWMRRTASVEREAMHMAATLEMPKRQPVPGSQSIWATILGLLASIFGRK